MIGKGKLTFWEIPRCPVRFKEGPVMECMAEGGPVSEVKV